MVTGKIEQVGSTELAWFSVEEIRDEINRVSAYLNSSVRPDLMFKKFPLLSGMTSVTLLNSYWNNELQRLLISTLIKMIKDEYIRTLRLDYPLRVTVDMNGMPVCSDVENADEALRALANLEREDSDKIDIKLITPKYTDEFCVEDGNIYYRLRAKEIEVNGEKQVKPLITGCRTHDMIPAVYVSSYDLATALSMRKDTDILLQTSTHRYTNKDIQKFAYCFKVLSEFQHNVDRMEPRTLKSMLDSVSEFISLVSKYMFSGNLLINNMQMSYLRYRLVLTENIQNLFEMVNNATIAQAVSDTDKAVVTNYEKMLSAFIKNKGEFDIRDNNKSVVALTADGFKSVESAKEYDDKVMLVRGTVNMITFKEIKLCVDYLLNNHDALKQVLTSLMNSFTVSVNSGFDSKLITREFWCGNHIVQEALAMRLLYDNKIYAVMSTKVYDEFINAVNITEDKTYRLKSEW